MSHTAENDAAVPRCPQCRHMPHDAIGWCPNMASDNDCACVIPPAKGGAA